MIPRFSQLFIYTPDKSSSVCKIFIAAPTLDKEQTLGRLFGVIEIEAPDRALWDTVEGLATDAEKHYYGEDHIHIDPSRPNRAISVTDTFEKTVQHFNDRLIELIKGGKLASLLDKMNIILGVFKDQDVYFTAVGNVSGFLIHQLKSKEHRMIDILDTSGSREEKLNPFKVLSTIVNGRIEGNDALLFCTNSLLDYLSLDKIKQTITTLDPAAATRHLKDLLLEASINTTFAGVLVKLTPQEALERGVSEIRLPQRSLDGLITTERATEQYLSPPLKFNVMKYSTRVLNWGNQRATTLNAQLRGSLAALAAQRRASKINAPAPRRLTITDEPTELDKITQEITQPSVTVRRPTTPAGPPLWRQILILTSQVTWRLIAHTGQALWRGLTRIINSLVTLFRQYHSWPARWRVIKNWLVWRVAMIIRRFTALPLRRRIMVGFIVFVVFIFSINLSITGQRQLAIRNGTAFSQIVTEINAQQDEIQGVLIYNDEERAKELLTVAYDRFRQLTPKTKHQRDQVDDLGRALDEINRRLQHIVTIQPELLGSLSTVADPATAHALTINHLDGAVYTINTTDNQLYGWHSQTGEFVSEGVSANTPQIITSVPTDDGLLYYHGGQGLVRFNPSSKTFSEVTAPLANHPNIAALAWYNRRLYIADSTTNQIYRLGPAGSGFAAPQAWLKDTSGVPTARAMAVDGELYLLGATGEIQRYASGRRQDFAVKNIDPAWSNPSKITADADSDNLYVLDPANRRIVGVHKRTGAITAQYQSDQFDDLRDLTVDYATQTAYLLNGNSLYRFKLN